MQFAVLFTNGKNGRSLDKRIIIYNNRNNLFFKCFRDDVISVDVESRNNKSVAIMISRLDISVINLHT